MEQIPLALPPLLASQRLNCDPRFQTAVLRLLTKLAQSLGRDQEAAWHSLFTECQRLLKMLTERTVQMATSPRSLLPELLWLVLKRFPGQDDTSDLNAGLLAMLGATSAPSVQLQGAQFAPGLLDLYEDSRQDVFEAIEGAIRPIVEGPTRSLPFPSHPLSLR